MAASAFHYVWPAEGTLRLRLMLCMLLVLSERVINLAAPIAFKHMVEVLSAVVSAPAEPEGQQGGNLVAGLRHLLMYVGGQHAQLQPQHSAGLSMGVLGAAANSTVATAAAPAGAGLFGFLQSDVLAPFWVLFYPWVFIYLGAFFLRGGSGSEGLLANLRDILWIPITQVCRAGRSRRCPASIWTEKPGGCTASWFEVKSGGRAQHLSLCLCVSSIWCGNTVLHE